MPSSPAVGAFVIQKALKINLKKPIIKVGKGTLRCKQSTSAKSIVIATGNPRIQAMLRTWDWIRLVSAPLRGACNMNCVLCVFCRRQLLSTRRNQCIYSPGRLLFVPLWIIGVGQDSQAGYGGLGGGGLNKGEGLEGEGRDGRKKKQ